MSDTAPTDDTRRRDRHGDARLRAAVLDVTLTMLEEVGYQQLKVDKVAARAGVGRGLVRRWWATRPLLVAEALQRLGSPPDVLPTGEVREELRELVARTAAFLANPLVVDALAGLAADAARDPVAAERLAALLAPRRAAEAAVLLSAVGRGELPASTDVRLLLDVVLGTLLLRRSGRGEPGSEEVDALVELLVSGCLARPAPATNGQATDGQGTDGWVWAADPLDGHGVDGHGPDGHAPDGRALDGHALGRHVLDGHDHRGSLFDAVPGTTPGASG